MGKETDETGENETSYSSSDHPLTCIICHEGFEEYHYIISPSRCDHKFHAICLHMWLVSHTSCPICQKHISTSLQIPWATVFASALVISHDMAVERLSYTYAFLSLMLRRFNTVEKWNDAKDVIIMAAEQFENGSTRLPYLDLSSRKKAEKEKKKWRKILNDIMVNPKISQLRIQSARRWLIDKLFFMLQE